MKTPWTDGVAIRGQVQRLWERGDLLRHLITGEPAFPLRLRLKGPATTEITDRFEAVRNWIAGLRQLQGVHIQWRELTHRVHGTNTLPQALWLNRPDDAFGLIGKRHEAVRYLELVETLRSRQPRLEPWVVRRPLQLLTLRNELGSLLDIVEWLQEHPRPGVYLRQVDLPGVHTKYIESRRSLLTEWLDILLAPGAIDARHTSVAQFARRYGFRDKPTHIRLRTLDERLALLPGPARPDLSLDAESFAALDFPVERVFITENEINFLAFPAVAGSLAIFGAGYGWETLARAKWLARCPVHYWGDIDTHGFAILDRLRHHFPHVESLLMDRETFMAHEALWGEEEKPSTSDLPRLTDEERALYDDLRHDRIGNRLRLEQERIGFGFVEAALKRIGR